MPIPRIKTTPTAIKNVIDKIFTSAGVASGIDLSLKVVENLYGKNVAKNTAKYMEYKY